MTDSDRRALTTAYASNTRTHAPRRDIVDYGWCPAINRLLAADYAFLPVGYDRAGCLLRGVDGDAAASIAAGAFGISVSDHRLGALERELGVVLLSNEIADAVSVARTWEPGGDACVIAIRASYFADEAMRSRAAVLGFAEPGVVFCYPFVAGSIPLNAVAYVFVRADAPLARRDPRSPAEGAAGAPAFIEFPPACADRTACESFIAGELERRGLCTAMSVPADRVPGRNTPG